MAEGSQTFEEALAALVRSGTIARNEALAYADSPTNLMWRMDNDLNRAVTASALDITDVMLPDDDDQPSFTEITLDVKTV